MSYLAIARKWRPAAFEDLVGQSHVVQTLRNAIRMERVSHAYLFSGARGVGKTSVARIFAKALRCPNAKEGIACQTCDECLAIADSRSVDVIEIDGASNNGVESVRGIRESVAYGAATGRYKIYIIDEVHMLSLSAFNALLKTLEEPPPNVLFLFATTEEQKIPITILSRCQRFHFRRLTISEIADRLRFILEAEKVVLTDDALRLLATHADGSLRDALSLLDQVLSFMGGQKDSASFGEKEIVQALGISNTSQCTDLLGYTLRKQIAPALKLIGDIYASGVDLSHFAERFLEEIRLLYLLVVSRETKEKIDSENLDISSAHLAELTTLAGEASLSQVERMAQITAKAIEQLSWASLPRFVLEMAVVRMSKLDDLAQLEQALKGNAEFKPAEKKTLSQSPVAPQMAPPRPMPVSRSESPVGRPQMSAVPLNIESEPPPIEDAIPVASNSSTDRWKAFVDMVMKKRPLLGALLCHANFKMEVQNTQKQIVLAFPEGSFYERQGQDAQNRANIEEAVKTFFGKDVALVLSTDTVTTQTSIEKVKQAEAASLKKKALEHPSVVKAQEILGAQIVDVNVEV